MQETKNEILSLTLLAKYLNPVMLEVHLPLAYTANIFPFLVETSLNWTSVTITQSLD